VSENKYKLFCFFIWWYEKKGCILASTNNKTTTTMKIKMTLISKGIKVEKICTTEKEAFIFERDMPAKYELLFTKIPYAIGKRYL
jgi:hypothetical protein